MADAKIVTQDMQLTHMYKITVPGWDGDFKAYSVEGYDDQETADIPVHFPMHDWALHHVGKSKFGTLKIKMHCSIPVDTFFVDWLKEVKQYDQHTTAAKHTDIVKDVTVTLADGAGTTTDTRTFKGCRINKHTSDPLEASDETGKVLDTEIILVYNYVEFE